MEHSSFAPTPAAGEGFEPGFQRASSASRWVLHRLASASPVARKARTLTGLHHDLAALFAPPHAERMALGPTLEGALAVDAFSSLAFSRIVLSTIDLAPAAVRLELVAIPRGPLPTLFVRLEIDSVGTGRLSFDGFGPGRTDRGDGRRRFGPLAKNFHLASAMLGTVRRSPSWVAALSSGGGTVKSRDIDALAREAKVLVVDALSIAHEHCADDRDRVFDATHRTAADALRAHDRLMPLVRWWFGGALSARLDALRFGD